MTDRRPDPGAQARMAEYDMQPRHIRDVLKEHPATVMHMSAFLSRLRYTPGYPQMAPVEEQQAYEADQLRNLLAVEDQKAKVRERMNNQHKKASSK